MEGLQGDQLSSMGAPRAGGDVKHAIDGCFSGSALPRIIQMNKDMELFQSWRTQWHQEEF